MSFNENHSISLHNYEEWFVLYMDNELTASQKEMVDNFLLLHPHLQEELELLLSTKLPADDTVFFDKASLKADAMKLNTVDESLLLYIDNELSATERKRVEEKIAVNSDFHLQHQHLQKTKLDASEIIPYPDKSELYRRSEKVVALFPVWMRIAVAVLILLFASLFFLNNDNNQPLAPANGLVKKEEPKPAERKSLPPTNTIHDVITTDVGSATAQNETKKPVEKQTQVAKNIAPQVEAPLPQQLPVMQENTIETGALAKVEPVNSKPSVLTQKQTMVLNKIVANPVVTSTQATAYNPLESPEEPAVTEEDFKPKKSSAKGFLRKVSRFLERRTGIGTVNADNEILVGAVALKLN
ncbi:hypothetical protein HRH25_18270 [Flavisolibacter sp. BT320]|nr:hypothetical protein [Flavisolibacter longurius]